MFKDKVILVTGGSGRLGIKFSQILLQRYPEIKKLIIFSRNKGRQKEAAQILNHHPKLMFYPGDILQKRKLNRATKSVDYIIHAVEYRPLVGNYKTTDLINTYIQGTQNLIEAAITNKLARVLIMSSNQACNPVDLSGSAKLCAEKLIIEANKLSCIQGKQTLFSVLRYGREITGTEGVVGQFRCLRDNGCLPISDSRSTRFWFTLEQGAAWALKSMELMRGGEIIIPQTSSLRIMDLAKVICPQCQYKIVGIKGEEKLHDLLISVDEAVRTLEYPSHFIIQPEFPWWNREEYKMTTEGREVGEGFTYSSDNSSLFYSLEELRIVLRKDK